MPTVRHARGTRAALNSLASNSLLVPWQLYVMSDESRVAVATSTSTYQTFAKEGEGGGGGGGGGGTTYEFALAGLGGF